MKMPSKIRELFLKADTVREYDENTIFQIPRDELNDEIRTYIEWLLKYQYAELERGVCIAIPYRIRLTRRWFQNRKLSDLRLSNNE